MASLIRQMADCGPQRFYARYLDDRFDRLNVSTSVVGAFWILLWLLVVTGCASSGGTVQDARVAYYMHDFDTAVTTLQSLVDDRSKDPSIELDLAIAEIAAGQTKSATSRLRKLRDHFDAAGPAVVSSAASLVGDDNLVAFTLSPEEQTLLRTLLAICELTSGGVDAESYSLQAIMHRRDAIEKERLPGDRDIALTPYIRGLIRESNHHDYDDASAAYQTVAATMPSFAPIGYDIQRAGGGVHSQHGHGVLYVFSLTGPGPVLTEVEAETTSAALSIASAVWSAKANAEDGEDAASLPNIASVKVPAVLVPRSSTASVLIGVNDQPLGVAQTITDMTQVVANRLEDQMPAIMARAIVRRATKEATVAASARAIGLDGNAASLYQFAAASSWASIEKADTRSWSLLPREFQIFRVELPVGQHRWSWTPLDTQGNAVSGATNGQVVIEDGRNAYRLIVAP